MSKRVAINGFGRIGRLVFRAMLEKNFFDGEVEVVAINDLVPADNLAYLLKYDTTHGTLHNYDIKAVGDDKIEISKEGNVVSSFKSYSLKKEPKELPWQEENIDLVIEATGIFNHEADAKGHLEAGAKKVLITAPSDDSVNTFLIGVNHDKYNQEPLVSNASCTTNALGPLVQVLLQEGIGIKQGLASTIHGYTASQSLQDAPSKKDYRRGRAAAENIIPTSTGAADAIIQTMPQLEGKITATAYRVPVKDGSLVDFTFEPERETSIEEINSVMKKAADSYLNGVLQYTEDAIVSSDIIHNPHSSIYDSKASIQLNSNFFKLVTWYDNEWGYSNRIVDMVRVMTKNS